MTSIESLYRREYRALLATLIRLGSGDMDLAEDSLQEAFTAALNSWKETGIPKNPQGWLISTARNKMIDRIRREKRGRDLLGQTQQDGAAISPDHWEGDYVRDDQIRLIFACCHPMLTRDSQVALALREVGGLSTEKIARAYQLKAETVKKRITRAKAFIKSEKIVYEIPSVKDFKDRLDSVLKVVYLIYNEAYTADSFEERTDLGWEAVTMARYIFSLISHSETAGLLSVLLFHESRRGTRFDLQGIPVPLEDQDRSQWKGEQISEALSLLARAALTGQPGFYTLQAAIASVHASAARYGETRWDIIVLYYDMLLNQYPSPIIELNRAIAVGMLKGVQEGLFLIDKLLQEGFLSNYHYAYSAKADFLARAGYGQESLVYYRKALNMTAGEREKLFLAKKIKKLSPSSP